MSGTRIGVAGVGCLGLLLALVVVVAVPVYLFLNPLKSVELVGSALFHGGAGSEGDGTAAWNPGNGAYRARQPRVPLTDAQLVWANKARAAATFAGIDPDLFEAQMRQESGQYALDVITCRRTSGAGAEGIAQVLPGTAAGLGIDPCDPDQALPAAAGQMRTALDRYGGDWRMALAAYNAGEGNLATYGIDFILSDRWADGETRTYVANILAPVQIASDDWFDLARSAIGSTYCWGCAGGRTSFSIPFPGSDCSGYVAWVYRNAFQLQLTAFTQSAYRETFAIRADQAIPGDLIQFNMSSRDPRFEHIAIYVGDGMMIHDSSINRTGGVDITPIWANQEAQFRRHPGFLQALEGLRRAKEERERQAQQERARREAAQPQPVAG